MLQIEAPAPMASGAGAVDQSAAGRADVYPSATSTATIKPFDYSSMPAAIADELRIAAARLRERIRLSYLETGRDLLAVKAKLTRKGEFGRWVAAEIGLTERTAENLMNAARIAEEADPEIISGVQPTVLYLLGAPSTPEAVRADALGRVERGERVTVSSIKDLISSARWKQREEQRRGQEQQRRAKMTKRQRRTREERERQEREHRAQLERERAERHDAISRLSTLLKKPGDDFRDQCIDLIEIIWPYQIDIIAQLRKLEAGNA